MDRRPAAPPSDAVPDPGRGRPDVAALPIVGLSRRRIAILAGIVAIAWLAIAIGRQVGDVGAIGARAADLSQANAILRAEIADLEREMDLIQRQAYVGQQARAHRLGDPDEIPFSLAEGAPPLGPEAPGSRSVAVGAPTPPPEPLTVWLDRLFGPAP